MDKERFEGKSISEAYTKFRTTPPQPLIDKILEYLKEKIPGPWTTALDVGCGCGQSTLVLAPHFQKVIGTDISSTQIEGAKSITKGFPNVSFSVSGAEVIPSEDNSLQLITAAECYHYFDIDKFCAEAKRALVPNGVVAVCYYPEPTMKTGDEAVDKEIRKLVSKLFHEDLGSNVSQNYKDIKFPFSDVKVVDGFPAFETVNVAHYIGYLNSTGAYNNYMKKHGKEVAENLLDKFTKDVMNVIQSTKSKEETVVKFWHDFTLFLGRKAE